MTRIESKSKGRAAAYCAPRIVEMRNSSACRVAYLLALREDPAVDRDAFFEGWIDALALDTQEVTPEFTRLGKIGVVK